MADTQLILETVVKGTEQARKSLGSVTKSVDTLGEHAKKSAEGLKLIGIASAAAFTAVVALGTMAVQQASKMQDLRQQFDTMLGSAEKGKALFLEIQKMASLTPFESSQLAQATANMISFGVSQEKVLPFMKQLGDISMGNNDRFQRLSLNFAKVTATGRLMGQELNALIDAGFNPLEEISRTTGRSMLELKQAMEDGQISVQMVEEAMKSLTSEGGRAFEGMEKASKTFSGVMSTLKDNIGITLAAIGGFANGEVVQGGLLDMLTKGMQKVMPYLDQFTKWASEPAHAELLKNIILIVAAVTGLVAGMVALGAIIGPVGAAIAFLTSPIGLVVLAIGALVAAGVYLYTHWDILKENLIFIWDSIVAKFNLVVDSFKLAWALIKATFDAYISGIKLAIGIWLEEIKSAWNAMWSGLGNAVTAAWEFAKDVFKNSVNWVLQKINAIIDGINWIAKAGAELGISVPMIPNIPYLAEGGIVTRPTVAMIGEAGPEAVIPLSKMGSGGGMGGGITINITGTFGQGAAEEIGDMIVKKLARASYI